MESLGKILGCCLSVALTLFFASILGTLLGAFAGWVVGLFFGETILGIFAAIGISGFKLWQLGAFLGFVGSFFRLSISSK